MPNAAACHQCGIAILSDLEGAESAFASAAHDPQGSIKVDRPGLPGWLVKIRDCPASVPSIHRARAAVQFVMDIQD